MHAHIKQQLYSDERKIHKNLEKDKDVEYIPPAPPSPSPDVQQQQQHDTLNNSKQNRNTDSSRMSAHLDRWRLATIVLVGHI